jgi:TRAP-type mannitol/chloroaromatic compound transport system substrate-binding protein
VIQIVTGIFLVMHYKPDAGTAFASVEYIMRDVPWGWLVRYLHSTGASAFFVVVYLHMFRGLIYGSYRKPRELVWIFGCAIFLCLMAEAFMGYLLPWGQMSYWGAQVIVNLFAAVPFGPGIPEYLAWVHHGGGLQLSREMFGKHGVYNIPCAIIPPEASGWFRREIKSVEDLKGLKMRFFGLGARAMNKLGVATQLLAPGDIFQALQLGTIDATEFSLPVMDQKLGFHQVAKFYYFPGWHQQATFLEFYINANKWKSLSDQHKAMIESACGDLTRDVIAEGEATQFKAMMEMRDKNGVQIRKWSPEIMAAIEKAWHEVIAEESAKNPQFKRVWDSYSKFRADYAIWRDHGYVK